MSFLAQRALRRAAQRATSWRLYITRRATQIMHKKKLVAAQNL
eukprot:CAMPEP_0206259812 /NCGR_PEP_ID=MMETSP0047_2-20121206/26707_1 /ASSEMBLY_ACC=CAM_ASM_000192 /TAXON_ID=195065 /ORGANISM="Chroomonas mesostigmatica_cf, Strain CCMP1168" /LENGTH=42 /DNA_ID= /DNA_START= /DNA_END= /DNA_ORIENTATION=